MYYNKHDWVNINNLAAISLEEFLTDELFKSDLTRAVYATSEYAYRRRFELIDTSREFESVEASSLQFPFMSYHIDEPWKPSDERRVFPMEEIGFEADSGLQNLRYIPIENTIKVYLHFDREDDARFAQNVLMFLSSVKRWKTQEVSYRFDTVNVPFRFEIGKTTFNPAIEENTWLKEHRLFILTVQVDIQSTLLFPPFQESDGSNFEPEPFVIVERVLMDFISGKVDEAVETSVEDLLLEDSSITLSSFTLVRATKTTAKIRWQFESQSNITHLLLRVNGKEYELTNEDYEKTIRGLHAGAEYIADLYAFNEKHSKHVTLRFSTDDGATSNSDLVGTTW